MIRERHQSFKLALILIDFVAAILAFFLALYLHFFIISPEKRDFVVHDTGGIFAPGAVLGLFGEEAALIGTYFYVGIVAALIQVMVFSATDLYHPNRSVHPVRELLYIARSVLLSLAVILALLFFYRGTSYSRLVIGYFAILAVMLHSGGHIWFRHYLRDKIEKGRYLRRVLLVGTGEAAARFKERIQKHSIYGYQIEAVIGPKKGATEELKPMIQGTVRDFKRLARQINPDLIVYAMKQDHKDLSEVVDFCDQEGYDCRIVPDMVDLITHRARIEDIDGVPILTLRDIPLKNGYNRFLKRSFDITFSVLTMIVLSPVFLVLALLVKFSSRGPVFFVQDRVGLDRRNFRCIKFRTMVVQDQAESDTTWGSKSDQRVTGIGNFLRKTSLDELPQFWNVLKGDMSVVGPRPERPHFVEQFKNQYTHYMRRHSVKSGITGWAQIQGYRGDTSIRKRVEADIYYIENWSLLMDIAIVLRTIPAVILNPGD